MTDQDNTVGEMGSMGEGDKPYQNDEGENSESEMAEQISDDKSGKFSPSRRGLLAALGAAGLLGMGSTGTATAASGDHLGETWQGSPGTGLGLKIDLQEGGNAIRGVAGAASNNQNDIGIKGETYSSQGIGLVGIAPVSSGNPIGLKGRVDTPDGTALKGEVFTTDPGSGVAVRGDSFSDGGTAIKGRERGSGTTYGVVGEVDSSNGYGLYTPDDAKVDGTAELATLSGSLTGGNDVTTLAGDNLTISGGQLNASGSGSSLWNDDDADNLLEPDSSYNGINVPTGTVDSDLQVGGDLQVTGVKNFVQAVDTPAGPKNVTYTAIEAGRARTEVDDVADMEDGHAVIDLPEHFGMVTSEEEDLVVQVTPYANKSVQPQVTHRSTDKIIVEDTGDGPKDYAFAYTVKGVRAGFEDRKVLKDGTTFATN